MLCPWQQEAAEVRGEGQVQLTYLVDFLLRVCEERREVAEGVEVEHHLGLFIRARHNVADSPQSSGLDARAELNTHFVMHPGWTPQLRDKNQMI